MTTQVTYRSVGPGATLEHLSNISPGIPVFRAVAKHMAWQHQSVISRGSRHKSPNKAKDVDREMRIDCYIGAVNPIPERSLPTLVGGEVIQAVTRGKMDG